jgi:hypothetical protein
MSVGDCEGCDDTGLTGSDLGDDGDGDGDSGQDGSDLISGTLGDVFPVWVGLLSVRVAGMTTVSRILLLMMIQEEVIQVVVMVVVLASSPPMLLTRCRLA